MSAEIDLYRAGHSIPQVAAQTGLPRSTVRSRLKVAGVLRSREAGISIARSDGRLNQPRTRGVSDDRLVDLVAALYAMDYVASKKPGVEWSPAQIAEISGLSLATVSRDLFIAMKKIRYNAAAQTLAKEILEDS